MNILFLTAATGGGHVKAAEALMQQMEKQIPGCKTRLVDSLKFINPLVDKLVTGTYLRTIKTVPGIYGRFYDLSEKDEFITDLVKAFSHILSRRLYSLFEQYSPDAVVCAHTMPLQMLSVLKRKRLLNIPLIGIVTDYTHHFFWKLEEVDAFIVAHERIKEDMVKMGIGRDKVHAFGIPVTENFFSTKEKSRLLKDMGLEDKPTLLLMGGSLGFGGLQSVFSSLLQLRRDVQIIAVTGCNKKLQSQLENLSRSSEKKVRVLGYTEGISELMDISDLLITKPGGITVSEALVKRLPFLLLTPIPGQEERNARFLVNSGAAVRIHPWDDMETLLRNTLDKPFILRQMSEAAKNLSRPHACEDITGLVKELILKPAYSGSVAVRALRALN